jgi:hypothetical protein
MSSFLSVPHDREGQEMRVVTQNSTHQKREPAMIHTTLYDLIDAIQTELSAKEDKLVVATVLHLIKSGRLRFLREQEHYN